jgi:hypothetical protein
MNVLENLIWDCRCVGRGICVLGMHEAGQTPTYVAEGICVNALLSW